jgi:hypothetical protein
MNINSVLGQEIDLVLNQAVSIKEALRIADLSSGVGIAGDANNSAAIQVVKGASAPGWPIGLLFDADYISGGRADSGYPISPGGKAILSNTTSLQLQCFLCLDGMNGGFSEAAITLPTTGSGIWFGANGSRGRISSNGNTIAIIGTNTAPITLDGSNFDVQINSTNAHDIYSPLVPAGWVYNDVIPSVATGPAGSSAINTSNYGAYMQCNTTPTGSGGACVNLFAVNLAMADNTHVWGLNPALGDGPGPPSARSAVRLSVQSLISRRRTLLQTAHRFLVSPSYSITLGLVNKLLLCRSVPLETATGV